MIQKHAIIYKPIIFALLILRRSASCITLVLHIINISLNFYRLRSSFGLLATVMKQHYIFYCFYISDVWPVTEILNLLTAGRSDKVSACRPNESYVIGTWRLTAPTYSATKRTFTLRTHGRWPINSTLESFTLHT